MIFEALGWLPAIILPVSTLLQLRHAIVSPDVSGISRLSWGLFAIANLGAWVYTRALWAPQSLLAFLLTAILDCAIVAVVTVRRSNG